MDIFIQILQTDAPELTEPIHKSRLVEKHLPNHTPDLCWSQLYCLRKCYSFLIQASKPVYSGVQVQKPLFLQKQVAEKCINKTLFSEGFSRNQTVVGWWNMNQVFQILIEV